MLMATRLGISIVIILGLTASESDIIVAFLIILFIVFILLA
jgi:hypothetical protein